MKRFITWINYNSPLFLKVPFRGFRGLGGPVFPGRGGLLIPLYGGVDRYFRDGVVSSIRPYFQYLSISVPVPLPSSTTIAQMNKPIGTTNTKIAISNHISNSFYIQNNQVGKICKI